LAGVSRERFPGFFLMEGTMSAPLDGCRYLGIEAGGTRTVAILTDTAGGQLGRWELGPANMRLLTPEQLRERFTEAARAAGAVHAVGVGMAGVRDERDQAKIRAILETVWPGLPFAVGHDLDSALAAAGEAGGAEARVIALSGTGSCCYGRSAKGVVAKVGGWGHLIGDKGSGYEIGLRALKACVYHLDRDGIWTELGRRVLRKLLLNEPNDLIAWAQGADKRAIAALAIEVFEAAALRDKIAKDILESAAHSLAKDAISCAKRLARPGQAVRFVLAGSVLTRQPRFAAAVGRLIRRGWPKAKVAPLAREGALGAAAMAREAHAAAGSPGGSAAPEDSKQTAWFYPGLRPLSPTEERNPRSMELDQWRVEEAVGRFIAEDARIIPALEGVKPEIAKLVRWVTAAFKRGGRLIYIGAGTSGRLGVLDASECPPTFRAPPEMVQGIIAGGQTALWSPAEGAEDDPKAGAEAVRFRGVTGLDVVVGIAASGRTPFVWGGLAEARARGAKTALVCMNPLLEIPARHRPGVVIAADVGPELLTGSTRLKSGTATKLILNMVTTLAMVGVGKAISNLMVDLNPSNVKLRDRAARILAQLTGCGPEAARAALEANGWVLKAAWAALTRPGVGVRRRPR